MTTQSIRDNMKNGWLKRLAWAAPIFFLVKGILWLTIPALIAFTSLD